MKIAVIGAGGLGAYFGGVLQRAGHPVSLLVTPRHVEPIRASGLRVTTDREDFTVHPAQVTISATDIGVVDVVVITVKMYQLDAVATELKALIGPNTIVGNYMVTAIILI